MEKEKLFLNKKVGSLVIALFAILVVAAVFLVVFGLRQKSLNPGRMPLNNNSMRGNGMGTRTPIRQMSLFSATVDDSQKITADGKFQVKISLSGAKDVEGSRITGAAVNFYDVPNFLSNPKIEVANSNWSAKSSGVVKGKVAFVADGLTAPITSNQNNFIIVTFDAKNPVDSQMKVSVELTDDNVPARGHQVVFKDVTIRK